MTKNTETETEVTTQSTMKVFDREAIRTAILDSKGETHMVDAFGVQIEIRTPALEDLLQYRDSANDEFIIARAIVNNCWVPGTEERVFDEADIGSIMKLKFTSDMKKLNKAVNSVLGDDEVIQKEVEDNTKSDPE